MKKNQFHLKYWCGAQKYFEFWIYHVVPATTLCHNTYLLGKFDSAFGLIKWLKIHIWTKTWESLLEDHWYTYIYTHIHIHKHLRINIYNGSQVRASSFWRPLIYIHIHKHICINIYNNSQAGILILMMPAKRQQKLHQKLFFLSFSALESVFFFFLLAGYPHFTKWEMFFYLLISHTYLWYIYVC